MSDEALILIKRGHGPPSSLALNEIAANIDTTPPTLYMGTAGGPVALGAAPVYPFYVHCTPETGILSSGAWVIYTASGIATSLYNDTPADAVEVTFPTILLAAGNYTFCVYGLEATNRGKLDWYLGATKIVSGQDWYGSSAVNVIKTASVAVSTTGNYVLKAKVNGKNGASSNYYLCLTGCWFKKA